MTFPWVTLFTVEVGSEVAVVAFHQFLDCGLKVRAIPFTPVVVVSHTSTETTETEYFIHQNQYDNEWFFLNPVSVSLLTHPCVKVRQRISRVHSWMRMMDKQAEVSNSAWGNVAETRVWNNSPAHNITRFHHRVAAPHWGPPQTSGEICDTAAILHLQRYKAVHSPCTSAWQMHWKLVLIPTSLFPWIY